MKTGARWIQLVRTRTNAFYYVTAAAALAAILAPELEPVERLLPLATSFVIVLIHELGHWGAARASGRRVTRLVVTPWRGLTTVGGPNPHDGFWALTAAAGPLAAGIFAAGAIYAISLPGIATWLGATRWIEIVLFLSLLESAGNLLPFGELDGKKVATWIAQSTERRRKARSLGVRLFGEIEAEPDWIPFDDPDLDDADFLDAPRSSRIGEPSEDEEIEREAEGSPHARSFPPYGVSREGVESALSLLNELMERSEASKNTRGS